MTRDYTDQEITNAVDRVRAGETAKQVSRDLHIPPKYIREWVEWDKVNQRILKYVNSLTPEQYAQLQTEIAAELQAEIAYLQEEKLQLLAEEHVLLQKKRQRQQS